MSLNSGVAFIWGANLQGQTIQDGLVGGPATTQNTATRLSGPICRCTKSVASGSFILPSIGTGEANDGVIVINDSGQTILVYPAAGEKMIGSANSPFSVTNGNSAFFTPIVTSLGNNPTTLDWRPALTQ